MRKRGSRGREDIADLGRMVRRISGVARVEPVEHKCPYTATPSPIIHVNAQCAPRLSSLYKDPIDHRMS